MFSPVKSSNYHCPFCGNELESRYSKCFNIYCQGQSFNLSNLVIFRFNLDLGIGRISKIIEIPTSKTLDDEDKYFIIKYEVHFNNNIIKIIHPIDLIHVVFKENERVVTLKGVGVINSNEFLIKEGHISYEILYPNGKLSQVNEADIYSLYSTPIKNLIVKNRIDPSENFLIKYWSNLFHSYYTSYQIKCITNSRLSLMPHQINVAHRLSEELFPRVILADEVGLGKTIETGIYIKEMMARNLAERVLIIVPATLVKQWQFEMQNKFNINFVIYDGKKIKEFKKKRKTYYKAPLKNPFYYDNLIICSLQFSRRRKYIHFLSQIAWDIVIFDEAHHLRRYLINANTGSYKETLNYTLAKKLSQSSQSLLLLTATPLQLHSFELFSLIEIIHPEAFDNFSDFEHFRKNMPFINLLMTNINQIEKLNTFEIKNTVKLLKNLKYIDKNLDIQHFSKNLSSKDFKSSLIKKIEREHTLSEFLIRNRKKNVFSKELLNKRIVHTIMINPTKEELELYSEIRIYLAKIYNASINKGNVGIGFVITTLQKLLTSSKYAILKSLERRLEQLKRVKSLKIEYEEDPDYIESELEDKSIDVNGFLSNNNKEFSQKKNSFLELENQEKILNEFYEKLKALPYDSKADKFIELILKIYRQNSKEKVLVFTQFIDTLFFLRDLLKQQNQDYIVDVFYGGLDKEEKDIIVEKFRNSQKFSILISSEIGGEGRNFQFCRILVNYDLPWNPMKLEQRIGRLDRIGQESREIYIYNFFIEKTIETDIIFALNKRINLFEESIGVLEPIIGTIEKDIRSIIFTETEGKKRVELNKFYRTLDEEIKRAKEIEMRLDDMMIDKKSFQTDNLISTLAVCKDIKLSHNELFLLVTYFFNISGSNYGNVNFLNAKDDPLDNNNNSIVEIQVKDELLPLLNIQAHDKYIGTFSLEVAREKEQIDFFALGHPLINKIIEFCLSENFSGSFTILNIIKEKVSESFFPHIKNIDELYLFIFSVKFQGYIVEEQISAIILDNNGSELINLAEYLLDIENFKKIFLFNEEISLNLPLPINKMDLLTQKAKSIIKKRVSPWKREIRQLNSKIFTIEQAKKAKLYEYNKKALLQKLSSLKSTLEKKKSQLPSEKQNQNILKIADKEKKEQKLKQIKNLDEQIKIFQRDIDKINKKIDDLSFNYEDLKNEMKKRNLNKFYTNLTAFSIIRFV